MKHIKQMAYKKYKLDWMLQHGYTLEHLVEEVTDYMDEVGWPFKETYKLWERDCGFDGEIWVCYDEFLDNEYQDVGYMKELLNENEFNNYCTDTNLATCQWCKATVPFTDEGGRCETQYGWLCNKCVEALQERGAELYFEDEEVE